MKCLLRLPTPWLLLQEKKKRLEYKNNVFRWRNERARGKEDGMGWTSFPCPVVLVRSCGSIGSGRCIMLQSLWPRLREGRERNAAAQCVLDRQTWLLSDYLFLLRSTSNNSSFFRAAWFMSVLPYVRSCRVWRWQQPVSKSENKFFFVREQKTRGFGIPSTTCLLPLCARYNCCWPYCLAACVVLAGLFVIIVDDDHTENAFSPFYRNHKKWWCH